MITVRGLTHKPKLAGVNCFRNPKRFRGEKFENLCSTEHKKECHQRQRWSAHLQGWEERWLKRDSHESEQKTGRSWGSGGQGDVPSISLVLLEVQQLRKTDDDCGENVTELWQLGGVRNLDGDDEVGSGEYRQLFQQAPLPEKRDSGGSGRLSFRGEILQHPYSYEMIRTMRRVFGPRED